MTTLFLNSSNIQLAEELLTNAGYSVDVYSEKGHHQIETNAKKDDLLILFNRREFHFRYDCIVQEGDSVFGESLFTAEWLSEWELRGSKTGQ